MNQRRREALEEQVRNLSKEDKDHLLIDIIGVQVIEDRVSELVKWQQGSQTLPCWECEHIAFQLGILEADQDGEGMPLLVVK